jgi:Spy/CpxP family protein refolding chaperone
MDRNLRGWVLGVTLSGLAGGVLAQAPAQTSVPAAPDHPWQGNGGGDHEHHGGRRWGHGGWGIGGPELLGNLRELGLTEAQHEQIHTIMAAAREQWKKTAGTAADKASWAALANPGDPGYSAAVQAAKQCATNRIQAMSDLQLEVYNVLTAEQKSELVKVLAEKSARWEQWQANHADHGPGGGPGID